MEEVNKMLQRILKKMEEIDSTMRRMESKAEMKKSMVELSKLKEEGSYSEYVEAFVELASKVEMSEEDLVTLFVEGLKGDKKLVRVLKPNTLQRAIVFARALTPKEYTYTSREGSEGQMMKEVKDLPIKQQELLEGNVIAHPLSVLHSGLTKVVVRPIDCTSIRVESSVNVCNQKVRGVDPNATALEETCFVVELDRQDKVLGTKRSAWKSMDKENLGCDDDLQLQSRYRSYQRLLQHIEGGDMVYGDIKYLVVEEADTMFDPGIGLDTRKFLGPQKIRTSKPDGLGFQTILVIAVMTKTVQKLIDKEFQGITHLRTSTLHKKIATARHDFIRFSGAENNLEVLQQVLEPSLAKGNKVMAFCNTLNSSRVVDHFLNENQVATVNYHGEMQAERRVKNLNKFKSKEGDSSTLVCTDLDARGLALNGDPVIMFDFPLNFIDYLHRTGRTARMETIICKGECERQRKVLQFLSHPDGFEADDKTQIFMTTDCSDILDRTLLRARWNDLNLEGSDSNEKFIWEILNICAGKRRFGTEIVRTMQGKGFEAFYGYSPTILTLYIQVTIIKSEAELVLENIDVMLQLRRVHLRRDQQKMIQLAHGIYRTDLPENDLLNITLIDNGHFSRNVCIAALKKGKSKVCAHSYDRNQSGSYFDEVLFLHFVARFNEQYKVMVNLDARAGLRVKVACEGLKGVLSAFPRVLFNWECWMGGRDGRCFIKEGEFEEISPSVLKWVKRPLEEALAGTGFAVEDIYTAEVVGSESQALAMANILTTIFWEEHRRKMNASEGVAMVCVLECAILSPTLKECEFQVNESSPIYVSISGEGTVREAGIGGIRYRDGISNIVVGRPSSWDPNSKGVDTEFLCSSVEFRASLESPKKQVKMQAGKHYYFTLDKGRSGFKVLRTATAVKWEKTQLEVEKYIKKQTKLSKGVIQRQQFWEFISGASKLQSAPLGTRVLLRGRY